MSPPLVLGGLLAVAATPAGATPAPAPVYLDEAVTGAQLQHYAETVRAHR